MVQRSPRNTILADVARRAQRLRPLLARAPDHKALAQEIDALAAEFEVDRTTVWRWLQRLRKSGGRTSALVPKPPGPASGKGRLPDDRNLLIEELLKRHYLRLERPALSRVMTEIAAAFERRGWRPPTRRTVQRRLDAMDQRLVAVSRRGPKYAREKFSARGGKAVVIAPLDLVQIDHTLADVILVDSVNREPLQRPWLTLAIDVASRMIAGVNLSF